MSEFVANYAKSLGFTYCFSPPDDWQIFPADEDENWLLSALENRWLLSIRKVPQIYLSTPEAMAFLERCHLYFR